MKHRGRALLCWADATDTHVDARSGQGAAGRGWRETYNPWGGGVHEIRAGLFLSPAQWAAFPRLGPEAAGRAPSFFNLTEH
jgi:hypothetical protein